jgi:hypothetical protein
VDYFLSNDSVVLMNRLTCQAAVLAAVLAGGFVPAARAQSIDQIGVTLLRSVTTNLDGSGIRVAQPEAGFDQVTNWEVNPADSPVQQPAGLLTYISADGSTTDFPNSLSSESGHADQVAGNFYGTPDGVATNVAHVDNFDANYLLQISSNGDSLVVELPAININDPVVNQSFIFFESDGSQATASDQQAIDSAYDNYAAQYNTLFFSGAGNGTPARVNPPATCYNGVGVGVSDGISSVGPTIDNGRAKPDIVAPGGETSFSTPYVAGAAAILLQAALRGDGGSDTHSAADMRTIKALLLNGAVKPADWTNSNTSPLDTRYGAGVLNLFNAYEQLAGGKQGYVVATSVSTNSPHLPTGDPGTVSVLNGWDFNTNSSNATTDGVNHYYFNVTNSLSDANFTATATLVWNRQLGETNINDLDLFLLDAVNGNLVACSTSRVDNVEQLWLPQLPPGRYDLQVLKHGGADVVSDAEAYALAFEFYSQTLSLNWSGTDAVLAWPVYPAGFVVETTTNLAPANWLTFTDATAIVINQQNQLLLNPTNSGQFFRLRLP